MKKKLLLPKGFLATGIHCGVKRGKAKDLALIISKNPATAAGCFTTCGVKAAPVVVSQKVAKLGVVQAIVTNSGNANAFTGQQGLSHAKTMAQVTACQLGIKKEQVLVCSTGIIGRPLPIDAIVKGIERASDMVSSQGGMDAAEAILTTDDCTKTVSRRITLKGKKVRITALAKGAGMIEPNMATMLCFIMTDAGFTKTFLDRTLRDAVENSFNRITVDGDMSTNDSVLLLANGEAGKFGTLTGFERTLWCQTLGDICQDIARMIVADGEGATKLVTIEVKEARSVAEAQRGARKIANSLLFKTAMFGSCLNWGRIVAALGAAGIPVKQDRFSLKVNGYWVLQKGTPVLKRPIRNHPAVREREIVIEAYMGRGTAEDSILTCDISPEYVTINK